MITFTRNFISLMRRFKMAMLLNVIGLSAAFAAFVIILIQVNYERRFDRCHPTADRVFRVELAHPGTFSTILPRGFVEEVLQSSPHIETGTLICPYIPPVYFTVTNGNEKTGFRETVQTCHPSLIQTFGFALAEGDPACLNDPEKIIIPQSMARKMFGNGSAVGKSIHAEESVWTKKDVTNFTVGAVYKDFPGNTQLRNVIYTAIDANYLKTNFGASNYICYVLLDNAVSAQDVADNFNRNFDFTLIDRSSDEQVKLTPLTDIYYLNEQHDGNIFRSGNKDTTRLLLGIAILVIVIAVINFINFSTALTPLRIKSINTQKVFGGSDSLLRRILLSEAVLVSLLAWLVSLVIIWLMSQTPALYFIDANLAITANLPIIFLSGVIALVTGGLAGIYPSRYMLSFPPALVLKGSFGLSPKGRQLRTALIGIQFVISIILIIGAGFVRLQNNFMQHYSLGFDKDQIAIVELNSDLYTKHHQTYADRLKTFNGIEDVAFSMEKVASKDQYNTNTATFHDKKFEYFMILCSYNFLSVMGIPIEEGRTFLPADEQSEEETSYIFNRTARTAMDMKVGDSFGKWEPAHIVGFTGDVKFTSLRMSEGNIVFVVTKYPMKVSYIRLKAGTDVHDAVDHIRKTLADIDPSYPFNVEFYDTMFDQLYHKEVNLRSMITLFSLLAIILSLVGVFGLVIFETQYRRKEIGIRKVHGATIQNILIMFNRSYIRIVAICFVIAVPVAWYGVHQWLESFAYKTPMYWWVFAVSFLIVATVTLLTVTFQNWQAANANPVNSIKTE